MDILLINSIVITITALFFIIKRGLLNLYSCLWACYAITAYLSYFCVVTGNYYNPDTNLGTKISIIPYCANYVSIFFLLYPYYGFSEDRIDWLRNVQYDRSFTTLFLYFSCVIFLFLGAVRLFEAFLAANIGFNDVYESGHMEGLTVLAQTNPMLNFFANQAATYYGTIRYVTIMIILSKLISCNWNSRKYLFMLLLCFVPGLFSSVSRASRGGLFFLCSDLLFVFFIIRHYIPQNILRKLSFVALLFSVVLLFYGVAISSSRFVENGNEDTFGATIRYFGEPMANLGDMYYDKVKHHLMGATFFPEFSNPPEFVGLYDFFDYWSSKIGVPIAYMGTFYGDSYIQFGLLGGLIFVFCVGRLFKPLVTVDKIYYLPIAMYYFRQFCIYGLFGYGFYSQREHFYFIVLVVICLILKNSNNSKQ